MDGTAPLTAAWDAGSYQIRAETFQSDVTTGTAPFTVASTTAVTNLNADMVDGIHSSTILQAGGSVAWSGTQNANNNDLDNVATVTFNSEYDNGTKSAAFTIDLNNGQKQKVTLNAVGMAITLTAPLGPGNFLIKLVQDATTGSRTVTWPGTVKWPGGTAPTLSTGTSDVDLISLYYDGTNYHGSWLLDLS